MVIRSVRRRPQPGDDLGELTLAVSGDAGDAEYLARAHLEGDVLQRLSAEVAAGRDVRQLEDRQGRFLRRLCRQLEGDLASDHQAGKVVGVGPGGRDGRDRAALTQVS